MTDEATSVSVTIETLRAFADAWNRHAIDDLMSYMSDDCVFESWTGTDVVGTCYAGRDAVRTGFMQAWRQFPDATWKNDRHFVAGNRGVSEWTFVGTSIDGHTVEVAGCDIFHFRGTKIVKKNSYRKQRY